MQKIEGFRGTLILGLLEKTMDILLVVIQGKGKKCGRVI
jgi:hypothetical protein